MPTYTYRNKETGEAFDVSMSISEMETYEANNPKLERVYDVMNIVDPINIGVQKPPSDFQKYVLGKVKQMPGAKSSALEKRWTIPREH